MKLEILRALPSAPSAKPPLLFLHGAFSGAWVWAEHVLDFVADRDLAIPREASSDVALWGRRDGPSVEVITTCVVDLPTALLRRHLGRLTADGAAQVPADARARLAAAVRAVLDLEPPRRG